MLLAVLAAFGFSGYALAIRPVMKIAGPFLAYADRAYTAVGCITLMLILGDRAGATVTGFRASAAAARAEPRCWPGDRAHDLLHGDQAHRRGAVVGADPLQPFTVAIGECCCRCSR